MTVTRPSDSHDRNRPSSLRAIQRHNGLADEVYETILAQLMALRIAPGARIS